MRSLSLLTIHVFTIFQAASAFSAPQESPQQQKPLPEASTKPFGINVAFEVDSARREEFINVLTNTNLEPALQFAFGQDVEDENKIYLHQEYKIRTDNPNVKTTYMDEAIHFLETQAFTKFPVASEFDLQHAAHSKKISNVKGALCLNVELNIKPEVLDEFEQVIINNKAGSDKEPLCMQYSWGQDIYDPYKFHFHEQYEGEDGLKAHFEGDHFKAWENFASRDPFTRPPKVEKFILL